MDQARQSIQGMIERTFHIQTITESGTAFAIEYGDNQYLVTAKHVVAGMLRGETVRAYSDLVGAVVSPVEVKVSDGNPDEGGVDVAVLQMPRPFNFQGSTPTLGRPDDLYVPQSVAMTTAEPSFAELAPVVIATRTGTVAAIVKPNQRGKYTGDFLVDIEAYPGFSGSPIICWDAEGQPRFAGVAARYSWRTVPAFGSAPVHTGFVGCFHISHVSDMIHNME